MRCFTHSCIRGTDFESEDTWYVRMCAIVKVIFIVYSISKRILVANEKSEVNYIMMHANGGAQHGHSTLLAMT